MKSKDARLKHKGFFISFEGGEGAGKSTQIRHLVEFFKSHKIPVELTLEPGGTKIGQKIRELLLDPKHTALSHRAELLLYLADRAQHVEELIVPALKAGKVVITDRYADSSNVYQGLCRKLGLKSTIQLNQYATQGLYPDIAIVLDLPVSAAFARMRQRTLDRMEREKATFHQKVRKGFLLLSQKYPKRIQVVNAHRSEEEVRLEIQDLVTRRICQSKENSFWKKIKQ
ncbi:MAG: dTMP kinase [Deltaproteobacteria bacterium]|jgi:dTMP kinase